MKNFLLLLTIAAILASCSKVSIEVPQKTAYQRNSELNAQIPTLDQLNDKQLTDWAVAKVSVVQEIQRSLPAGTVFSEHYPTPTTLKGVDCEAAWNSAKTNCNWLFAGNLVGSGILAVGAAVITTPLGGGAAGLALVGKDVNNYVQCRSAAIQAHDNCVKAQTK